jgi:N-acetylglutamate synthase-like GNAT family acetyltransferase
MRSSLNGSLLDMRLRQGQVKIGTILNCRQGVAGHPGADCGSKSNVPELAMPNWIIRRATALDAPELATCIEAAYSRYRSQISDLPDVTAGLEDDINDHTVWVAVDRGAVVGGLVLIMGGDQAKLANVAVDDKTRGTGLGRALIEVAQRECRHAGIKSLSLTTHAAMTNNIALYSHLGWVITDQTGNKVQMMKPISDQTGSGDGL